MEDMRTRLEKGAAGEARRTILNLIEVKLRPLRITSEWIRRGSARTWDEATAAAALEIVKD